jgi:hypothetical protein
MVDLMVDLMVAKKVDLMVDLMVVMMAARKVDYLVVT